MDTPKPSKPIAINPARPPLKTLAFAALTESVGVTPTEACQMLGIDKHHSANLRARFERLKASQSLRLAKLSSKVIENTAKIYVKETNKIMRGELVEALTIRPADALRAAEIVQNRIDPLPKQGAAEPIQPIDLKAKYMQVNINDNQIASVKALTSCQQSTRYDDAGAAIEPEGDVSE